MLPRELHDTTRGSTIQLPQHTSRAHGRPPARCIRHPAPRVNTSRPARLMLRVNNIDTAQIYVQ